MFHAFKSLFTESGVATRRLTPPVPGGAGSAGRTGELPGAMATFVPPALDGPADMSMRLPPALGLGVKRAFDAAAALTLLLLLSPLMLTVALIVMKDGGPCLFGHTRIGANGRKFKCLKFRSMVMNADVVLKELLASDPVARAEWERDFKLRDDVRITRLGRFIRRTSIDELPQLWNVVRGDMSLVGPRPVVEKELERYGDAAAYYLRVLPGITGPWQVSGRNETDYGTRISLDVAYVRNWSFVGDIVILFKTVGVVLHGRGAY